MTKLKSKPFDDILKEEIAPLLEPLGYAFSRGTFLRELTNGVLHLLIFDLNPARGTFRVIVGTNARQIAASGSPEHVGTYAPRYLGPRGLSGISTDFQALDKAAAQESLLRVRSVLESHALPWLNGRATLSAVADDLSDQDDYLKGKLLLADGKLDDAAPWLRAYRGRLEKMERSAEVTAALETTDQLLAKCRG